LAKTLIFSGIALAFNLIALFSLGRYHMHMFQLNSYKPKEEALWLKKNAWENTGRILGVVIAMFTPVYVAVPFYVFTYLGNRPSKEERVPFNFTARMKRLTGTLVILWLVFVAFPCVFVVMIPANEILVRYLLRAIPGIYLILIPYIILLANRINKPLEKMIGNKFIIEAKEKIESMPDLKVVGITGSYGKTSVKNMIYTLLSGEKYVLKTPGNFNTTFGVTRTIREQLEPVHDVFVCEMGARNVGDIKEICDLVHPDLGIITSVGAQHLESFRTQENITATKFELFDAAETVVLNADNKLITDELERRCGGAQAGSMYYSTSEENVKKIVTYGMKEFFSPSDIKVSTKGTSFTMEFPDGDRREIMIPVLGGHQVINFCGAAAVAYELGVSKESILKQAKKIAPVEHRLELKRTNYGIMLDDAYNSNPAGAREALKVLGEFEEYKIVLTPGMVELGKAQETENRAFAAECAKVADMIILVTGNADPMEDELEKIGYENFHHVHSLFDALNIVINLSTDREKVVLFENDLPDQYN